MPIANDASEREAAAEPESLLRAAAPVQREPVAPPGEAPDLLQDRDGVGLCLSGGGYRAMLFHVGALWRLSELGYLEKLNRISSVSGGSITAGALAVKWSPVATGGPSAFKEHVVLPVRSLASRTIDLPAIVLGILLPGSIGNRLAHAYERHLVHEATLQSLPDEPLFVFNATSLQSGALWRFTKEYLWDWKVGEVENPMTRLAVAIAASAAFPPFLSPIVLRFGPDAFKPGTGEGYQRPPFTTRVVLTDGGVYDNLGLETIWKSFQTVLISDGGGRMGVQARPWHFWPLQTLRVLSVIDNQVRSLRKRQSIDGFKAGLRDGTYWGITTDITKYPIDDPLPCPRAKTLELAATPTRLKKLPPDRQERLINWGYAVCDAAMRAYVRLDGLPPRPSFPYADVGV